MINLLR